MTRNYGTWHPRIVHIVCCQLRQTPLTSCQQNMGVNNHSDTEHKWQTCRNGQVTRWTGTDRYEGCGKVNPARPAEAKGEGHQPFPDPRG